MNTPKPPQIDTHINLNISQTYTKILSQAYSLTCGTLMAHVYNMTNVSRAHGSGSTYVH